MTTFSSINEVTLAAAISRCQNRLVYIAPSVTLNIVKAIEELLKRQDAPSITLVIDTDPEVCRLGYGTFEGLKYLQAINDLHCIGLRYQDGLRVGVLISDDEVIAYAPTPLLIEAGTTSDGQTQSNAIILGRNPLRDVLAACEEGAQAEIGNRAVTPEMLNSSLKSLEEQPPKAYDISRIERVYSSKLQYVEFEVVGYRLSSRRVKIPNDLLMGNDEVLGKRLQNSFSLLEGKDTLAVQIDDHDSKTNQPKLLSDGSAKKIMYSEIILEQDRKKIYEDFLTIIPKHGQLISRARRNAFDDRITWFKSRIESFKKGVCERLENEIEMSIQDLSVALLEGVRGSIPDRLLKFTCSQNPSDEELIAAIKHDLWHAFDVKQYFNPQVKVVYKDLTYETIRDSEFRELLDQKFRGLNQSSNDLFSEHDAAPEFGSQSRHNS